MIENVKQEFRQRFSDFQSHESDFILFSNSFHCDPKRAPANIQLELIQLQESSDIKIIFLKRSLGQVLFLSFIINLSSFAQECLQNGFSF